MLHPVTLMPRFTARDFVHDPDGIRVELQLRA